MDTGTIITILVVILICILPFAILNLNNSRGKKRLVTSLNELAKQHDCKIKELDFWSNSVIGLSEDGNFVFAIRKIKAKSIVFFADLKEMHKCRLLNAVRTVKNNGSDFVITDRLALIFEAKNKEKSDLILEFYNTDYDSLNLTGELQLVEKWCNLLNINMV